MGGGSIVFWGAFGFNGTTDLGEMHGRQKAEDNLDVIRPQLTIHAEILGGPNFILQQDNARIHTPKLGISWLSEQGNNVLPWPAVSPDINPIENVWGLLTREISANGRQYDTISELRDAILMAWDNLDCVTLQRLIISMRTRIGKILLRNGKFIGY